MNDPRYPLLESNPDTLRAASGRALADITLDADDLTIDDLTIHADALRAQAEIARAAGYPQLAANLIRGAELTAVPNDEVLRIYALLRPKRASRDELTDLADRLDRDYGAVENARFIREAVAAYAARGLLRSG